MARIEQGEKARKEVAKPSNPKLRLRTRLMETVNRIFTSKQEKLSDQKEMLAGMSRRRMLALSAAAIVAACAPLPAAAQDTTPKRSPKEPASATEKSEIEYDIITDASELEPYFKNAEGKFIKLEHRKTEKIGEYLVTAEITRGVGFSIESLDGTYKKQDIPFVSPMENVNVFVIDLGKNHPVVRGEMLVFADNWTVYFLFFDKTLNAHSIARVPLETARMRRGPISTGYGISDDGVFVLNAPKDLKSGDVICQAGLWNDGSSGGAAFKFVPDQKPKQVAMK